MWCGLVWFPSPLTHHTSPLWHEMSMAPCACSTHMNITFICAWLRVAWRASWMFMAMVMVKQVKIKQMEVIFLASAILDAPEEVYHLLLFSRPTTLTALMVLSMTSSIFLFLLLHSSELSKPWINRAKSTIDGPSEDTSFQLLAAPLRLCLSHRKLLLLTRACRYV